jgi:hypothetical protein
MDQFAREVGMLGLPSLVVAGRPRSSLVRLTSWDEAAILTKSDLLTVAV